MPFDIYQHLFRLWGFKKDIGVFTWRRAYDTSDVYWKTTYAYVPSTTRKRWCCNSSPARYGWIQGWNVWDKATRRMLRMLCFSKKHKKCFSQYFNSNWFDFEQENFHQQGDFQTVTRIEWNSQVMLLKQQHVLACLSLEDIICGGSFCFMSCFLRLVMCLAISKQEGRGRIHFW